MRSISYQVRDIQFAVSVPAGTVRAGIGRLDVLIVLGLVAVLAAVNSPLLQTARETARRMSCQSRLRQLSLALQNYHDAHRTLPPAAIWGAGEADLRNLPSHALPTPVYVTRQNWLWFLLPTLDQMSLAEQFEWPKQITDPANANGRTADFALMRCPSDTYNTPANQYVYELPDGAHATFSRGNYAINGGSEFVPAAFGNLSNPGPTDHRFVFNEETQEFQWWGNGIAGFNKCFSLDDLENGQSTTVAFEEVRSGLVQGDPRGVWSLGQIGGSITWGHGITGDAGGPNFGYQLGLYERFGQSGYVGSDDILGAPGLKEQLSVERIEAERMQFCLHCDYNGQATARSQHPGRVHIAMLDGQVRAVNDHVDTGLWHILHSRETAATHFGNRWENDLSDPPSLTEARVGIRQSGTGLQNATGELQNSVDMRFVRVPAGEFMMGLANKDNQLPSPIDAEPHSVRISSDYDLGMHEVTQEQFTRVMGRNPSWHAATGSGGDLIGDADTSHCPVESVSWEDATEFCRKLSELPDERDAGRKYRLPTEAEWERACRAGEAEPIPLITSWEVEPTNGEIASKDAPPKPLLTQPVGSYSANAFGLHDMCGNVYEWVSDFRVQGYYPAAPDVDPQGPADGYLHVIRGWHWVATGPNCKDYVAVEPGKGSRFVGFRVVCDHLGHESLTSK